MKSLILVIMTLWLSACAELVVTTDYDSGYAFSAIKTYAWLKPKEKLIIDPYVDNDLMNLRISRAINQAMEARGFKQLEDVGSADILVSYHISSQEKLSVTNYHSHFGYYPCRYCFYDGFHTRADVDVKQYRAGAFMIDFIEPAKRELVWRGVSERRLPVSATPQQRDQFVNETVTAIISRYPPK